MKLKGIDGDPHKRWSMWFNSTQREEPYQRLTSYEWSRDAPVPFRGNVVTGGDRKSTRLNSSHANISYAVFCLKKKKIPTARFWTTAVRRESALCPCGTLWAAY